MNVATSTILAVDAGNTRIKWGIYDGQAWLLRGAFATRDAGTAIAFSQLPAGLRADRIVVSNVAGPEVAQAIRDALDGVGESMTFIQSQPQQCGVTSHYQPASALGSDRWAGLVAAHQSSQRVPRVQLVVMAGTALTVDGLTATGAFLGGIIVPGPALMRASLNRGTAQLPSLGLDEGAYQTFPRNTHNAITTGAIEACSGAVQRMYTHLSAHTGEVPHCIASGGAIHAISPHLPFPVTINDNLVLEGLLAIASSAPASADALPHSATT